MIGVTTLTSYNYCPRKLFMQKVLKLVEIPKAAIIKGNVKHDVFESINRVDPILIKSFQTQKTLREIENTYINEFTQIFRDLIIKNKTKLNEFEIQLFEFFKDNWKIFEIEAKERAKNVYEFMQKHKIFGDELWLSLTPKIESEFNVVSNKLDLIGRVDRLEIFDDSVIPYEIKSGKSSHTGPWKDHKLQLAAYMMMLNEKGMKTTKGMIKYIDENKEFIINLDNFLKKEVIDLNETVQTLLHSKNLPEKVENVNKCKSCGLKETCFNVHIMEQKMKDLTGATSS